MRLKSKPSKKQLDNPFDYLLALKEGGIKGVYDEQTLEEMGDEGAAILNTNVDAEIDICEQIRKITASKVIIPRDLKIDDGDLPTAKNFYEWCTQDRFGTIGDERPFLEQLIWGVIAFNEACVAEGSYVYSGRGLLKIEDFVGNPTSTGMQRIRQSMLTDSGVKVTSHGGMTSKRRKCLKITYASGHSIVVTPDHRVQTLNSALEQVWFEAADLKIGMQGILPFGTNLWSKHDTTLRTGFIQNSHPNAKQFEPLKKVTPELARLVGYIISDGFMNQNTIGFINTDDGVISDFIHCVKAVFGYEPDVSVGMKLQGNIKSKVPYTNVFLHGSNFVGWLYHIGFVGTNSHNKEIPPFILESSDSIVKNCLRAIFDCDGYVDETRVGISLSSINLVRQISLLMQNIGIFGKFTEFTNRSSLIKHRAADDVRNKCASWVCTNAEGTVLYADIVGTSHKNKQSNLNKARKRNTVTRSTCGMAKPGFLPYGKELYAALRKVAQQNAVQWHDACMSANRYTNINHVLTKHVDFIETYASSVYTRLKKLNSARHAYAEIVKIEDAGYHKVYDLTVPSVENFVCNGVVVHNCYNLECTDLEWLLHDHKVDDTFSKFERKVTMLEFGVCPNCGKGRSEMFHAGKMPFYNELGINAGQRCVRGSTPVITKDGIIRIEELRPNSDYGFTEFEEYVHNGECMEKSSHFYAAEPEPVTRVTTATGFCVVGTPDHPLMTEHGFKKISDITTSDKVRIYIGTRQFGVGKCESPLLDGKFFRDTNVPRSIRTLDAENTTLWLQGLFHAPVHAFLSEIALRDVSAMLLNAGFLHSIHGPAIKLTDKQFEDLHAGRYKVGVAYDPVSQITKHCAEETFDFTLPETHEFLTGGILSHNSGKSHTLGTYLYPYYNHRLMKLQNPAQFYGLSRTTRLQGTFAALTYTQAKDTLWTPFYGAITQTNWYRQYHAMLKHYSNVYGEKLFKLNDSYVDYRARSLFWHPMSPDMRVMRGRTRVAACYTANTLVSTDHGLIRIDDPTIVGMNTIRGSKIRAITNWSKTKWATNVVRVKLKNGMELDVTADHIVLSLSANRKPCRAEAHTLQGKYVGVTLGGQFPKDLELHHNFSEPADSTSSKYVRLMCELGSFTKPQLLEMAAKRKLPKLAGINSVMASLANAGVISKQSLGCRKPYLFTIESSEAQCLACVRGTSAQADRKYGFTAPLYMTARLGYVLGCMVADGSYKSDHEFTYTTASIEKAERFVRYMESLFGVSLRIAQYNSEGNEYFRINMGTKEVKRFFRYLGLAKGSDATNKTVPWSILQAPRTSVIAYLNAGFVTDGGINYDGMLYYSTNSKELAKQQQMLLTRCGYYARIRKQHYNAMKNAVYSVILSRDSTNRFLTHDYKGFTKRSQQKTYKNFIGKKDYYATGKEFLVPYSKKSMYVRPGFGYTQEGADPNIVWVEVESVTSIEDQWVYDISVAAKDEMFTANGVIAKNSIDEIAYFDANKDNQKVTISGHEVYDALANSLATVRTASEILLERGYDDVFPAYMMNVTSPVSKADMIHVIIERAKGSRSIFAVTRPTWEVNPNFKRNSQFIMEQYRRDPISADRNFGANPPAIANPFIANHKMIQDCEGTHKNTIKVSPVFKKAKVLGQGYMYGELDKIKKSGKASLVAIDAGITNNSFALAVGSTDGYNLSVDLLAEIIPVPGYPINFTKMYDDLILPIMQARNAKVLLADRWNSRMLLDTAKQDMADIDADEETFIAEQYSLKYIDMVGVRTCMEMGILKFPKSEIDTKSLLVAQDADFKEFYKNKPVAHLFKQLYTIKDLTNGVGKGDGYTDDLWRATALLVHGLQSEKYQMLLSQENFDAEIAKPLALGASKLYSGGGSQVGQGGGGQTIINGAPLGVIKRR